MTLPQQEEPLQRGGKAHSQQWLEKHEQEYVVSLSGGEPRFDIAQMLDDYSAEFATSELQDWNEHDAEDCAACSFSDGMCPYHLGFENGSKWAYALAAAEYMGLKPVGSTLTNCTCKAVSPSGFPKLPCVAHPANAGAYALESGPAEGGEATRSPDGRARESVEKK